MLANRYSWHPHHVVLIVLVYHFLKCVHCPGTMDCMKYQGHGWVFHQNYCRIVSVTGIICRLITCFGQNFIYITPSFFVKISSILFDRLMFNVMVAAKIIDLVTLFTTTFIRSDHVTCNILISNPCKRQKANAEDVMIMLTSSMVFWSKLVKNILEYNSHSYTISN